jgi:hypothetical protein
MIVSKIITKEYIYFNLHAEEVVTSNFIEDDNSGVFCDRLQISTLNRVIDSLKKEKLNNVILDFNNIIKCQPNLNKVLIELKKDHYKIQLINLKKSICSELSLDTIENSKNNLKDEIFLKFHLFEDENDNLTDIDLNIKDLFENNFKTKIKTYIEDHKKPHTSSFVYLTSFVDIKKFISNEKPTLIYSLYVLAMKIKTKWKLELKENPILICQSLNSSYLVSILSTFLKLDILIFDSIGPVNNLYNRLDNNISEKRKYIIVSDLVCLGTEVKIVKNIINFIGGKCLGNISLIKTETLNNSDIKKINATISVFSIKKSNNKELNYNITTDLEPLS